MVSNEHTHTPNSVIGTLSYEDTGRKRGSFSLLGVGLSVLLASATFFSGLHAGTSMHDGANIFSIFGGSDRSCVEADTNLGEFWHVWSLLERKFVQTSTSTSVTTDTKIQGAIDGLVQSYGDPYTMYFPPEDAEMFDEDISGNFGGVGMEVGMREGMITVIAPLPDSPSERAGILAGDIVVKIDGESTEGMNVDEAVRKIRGEKGTNVSLTLFREGETEVRELSVTRDTITVPTTKTEIRDGVFVLTLYSFNAISEMEFQKSLREYVKSGARKMVIDVRGNPGGYLESAVSIASYFLPTGKPVVRESAGEGTDEEVYRSSGKTLGYYAPEKMVVLVDGGSASASEILAGALQEHGIAKLVGEQTFGKGSVQELIPLDDGSSIKITIARWLTPNGISISEGGLTPDVVVERTVEDRTAERDPQLDAAIKLLNE